MAAAFRKPACRDLPFERGMLRVTGDTLEGPRETDAFDVVASPGGDVGVVLLDLQTRQPSPREFAQTLISKATQGLAEGTPL
ncbi:MAG TPA: hypothetical protein VIW29_18250, partial [Polyangiaceae bacterium]